MASGKGSRVGLRPVMDVLEARLLLSGVLTVNNGTGGGTYAAGTVVNILAAPQSGYGFYNWSGGTGGTFGNVNDSGTTFTMPDSDVTIYANCSPVNNVTSKLREGGGGTGFTAVTMDDAELDSWQSDTVNDGGTLGMRSGMAYSLLAGKTLFTDVPQTSGGNNITITSAKLHLFREGGSSSDTVYADRMTSNWLTSPAGGSETNVTYAHRDKSAGLTWAGGSFSASDYTTTDQASTTWSNGWADEEIIDITALMQDIYSSGNNYGLVLRTNDAANFVNALSSENGTVSENPYIEITYRYGKPTPMHTLTVVNGTASGSGNNAPGYFWEGQPVSLTANSPAGGQQFNMWYGDLEPSTNVSRDYATTDGNDQYQGAHQAAPNNFTDSSLTYSMYTADATVTATYRPSAAPNGVDYTTVYDWYPEFNDFCIKTFGAQKEPLAYTAAGGDSSMALVFQSSGDYSHGSENAAFVASQTNLPATAVIQWGTDTNYTGGTVNLNAGSDAGRYYYLHEGYITGLSNNTTYHYRFVVTDERGNVVYGPDKTVSTATPAGNVVNVSGGTWTTAYTCGTADTTYVLQGDVTANYTGFEVKANNVTIDLNGYTLTYDNTNYQINSDNFNDYIQQSSYGIRAWAWAGYTGVKVYDGTVTQGLGYNSGYLTGDGYSPIAIENSGGGEVAGVTAVWCGIQIRGMDFKGSSGVSAHNDIFIDHGGEITDRQMGVEAMYEPTTAYDNLVKRARQRGITAISGGTYHDNEMYIDSSCTNSFGLFCYDVSNVHFYNNKVFGTGYLLIGIGTVAGCTNIELNNNYVFEVAGAPDYRSDEYGAESEAVACRVTWGGNNIDYHNETYVTDAKDGGVIRGVWLYTENNSSGVTQNVIFQNSTIKADLLNTASLPDQHGAVSVTGDGGGTDPKITYLNDTIISNFCNVTLGDDYGVGCNAEFDGCTLVEDTSIPRGDYYTIRTEDSNSTGNKFFDTTLRNGASLSSYHYDATTNDSFYVGWTLTVYTRIGAAVTIKDTTGATVYSGAANSSGVVSQPLIQYLQTPSGLAYSTPYTVSSVFGGVTKTATVNLTGTTSIALGLLAGDADCDGAIGPSDLALVSLNWAPAATNMTWLQGDFNFDGAIGPADLALVGLNWSPAGYVVTSDDAGATSVALTSTAGTQTTVAQTPASTAGAGTTAPVASVRQVAIARPIVPLNMTFRTVGPQQRGGLFQPPAATASTTGQWVLVKHKHATWVQPSADDQLADALAGAKPL